MRFPQRDYFDLWSVVNFDPGTAALIALGTIAAGATIGAVGQIASGQAQAAASTYNADASEAAAVQAEEASGFEAERQRERARRLLATQRAAYAKSGVTMEGSPVAVLGDTAEQAELDAQAILYEGAVVAHRNRTQAALDRYQGKVAAGQGVIGAATQLLGAGARGAAIKIK